MIVEIVPKIPLKYIPQANFSGMINYGGEPVPILDLSLILTGRPSKNCMHTRIMLISNPEQQGSTKILGFIAEKIIEIREIDPFLFSEPSPHIKSHPFLNGIFFTENESIQKINVDQLWRHFMNQLI